MLERALGVQKPKWHDVPLEQAILNLEGCLPLVPISNVNLVVSAL